MWLKLIWLKPSFEGCSRLIRVIRRRRPEWLRQPSPVIRQAVARMTAAHPSPRTRHLAALHRSRATGPVRGDTTGRPGTAGADR